MRQIDTSPVQVTVSTAPNTLDLHPQPDTDVDMISPCPEALDDLVAQLLISNVDASTQTDLHLPPSVNIQVIIIPSLLGPLFLKHSRLNTSSKPKNRQTIWRRQ